MIQCLLCKNVFETTQKLSYHIRRYHHISVQMYYDTFLKQPGEGICANPSCTNSTNFGGLAHRYGKFCCQACFNRDPGRLAKVKQTFLDRYGGMGTASQYINDKIKRTNIQRYGTENLYASEYCKQKIRNTCLMRYGVETASQAEEVKAKIVQTSLERYGTTNPGNGLEARKKAAITRRKNDNDSSWEDFLENELKRLNIEYKKRYNCDPRYPYMCDFYLPQFDMFIEINGYFSHGKHWFNEKSNEDKKKLDLLMKKAEQGHKQYTNAINVWTVKDPEKRATAIANNLNYVVLWTRHDIEDFVRKLSQIERSN